MPGPNGDPRDSAKAQAAAIEKAIIHFVGHEPDIPYNLHEDLATILAAARAHAGTLMVRAFGDS